MARQATWQLHKTVQNASLPLNRELEDMSHTIETIADGFAFLEGPRWRDGMLWFSDMHDEKVYAMVPGSAPEIIATVPQCPSGLGWLPDGRMLIVSMLDKRLLVRADDGTLSTWADLSDLAPRRINDMVVAADGTAYVGNFGFLFHEGEPPAPTVLARIAPDGSAHQAADGLMFPNGSVITKDGKTLVVGESYAAKLTAFDIGPDGALSNKRDWANLSDGAVPDGICLDAEGAIWVASPTTGTFLRIKEGGEVLDTVVTGRQAIACTLGGADGKTLFMLTSETTSPDEASSSSKT